jgi:hypothetical protein
MADEKYNRRKLFFKNNNGPRLVAASHGTPTVSLIKSLGISPLKNLILPETHLASAR